TCGILSWQLCSLSALWLSSVTAWSLAVKYRVHTYFFATHVTEPAKLLRVVERKVTFTQEDNIRAIGAIVIEDINHTIGGEASILDGGPTSTYVTLKFKSKRGQGLDFNVYIYDSP
ncbi:uncharacterized protein LOC117898842, partial [Drosophila subobscura]|uniref:uncharacterized protein LOC117898842 n=1 Tax=Drosophila subobscura TaxID=7241 RepID=UPI00155B2729